MRLNYINNFHRVLKADEISPEGVVTLFFGGTNSIADMVPTEGCVHAIGDYITDARLKTLGVKKSLYFVNESNGLMGDDNLIAKDDEIKIFNSGNNEISGQHIFIAQKILPTSIVKNISNVTDLATRKEACTNIANHLSRINLLGFCYGTIFIQKVLLAIQDILYDQGYSETEVNRIKTSLSATNLAPVCRLEAANLEFGQLFYATTEDQIIKRRIDYETLPLTNLADIIKLYSESNTGLLLSNVARPPKAVRILRKYQLIYGESTTSVFRNGDYKEIFELIERDKVTLSVIDSKSGGVFDTANGHSMFQYLESERLSGSQARKGEIYTFYGAIGVNTVLRTYQDMIIASAEAIQTKTPRNCHHILEQNIFNLSESRMRKQHGIYTQTENRFQELLRHAREYGCLIER